MPLESGRSSKSLIIQVLYVLGRQLADANIQLALYVDPLHRDKRLTLFETCVHRSLFISMIDQSDQIKRPFVICLYRSIVRL